MAAEPPLIVSTDNDVSSIPSDKSAPQPPSQLKEEVTNRINDSQIPDTVKSTLIEKILYRLNMLPPDQKEKVLQEEIQNAKRETGKIEHSFTNSITAPKLSAKEKVAIFTSVGAGLAGIADAIKTNPVLMQLAVAGSGLILATPVGQGIVGIVAICAVGYYAVLAVKAKFQGLYTVLRTLDEFTILLEKIQRMIRVTVFISTTYNFQINVDEINNQIKIILKRFEKTLDDVDIQKIESQAKDAKNLENLSANTSKLAAESAAKEGSVADDATKQQSSTDVKPQGGGRRRYQKGGGLLNFYKKFTFPVESWNRELLDDVTKLNIRLTTAMGEFTIVLNVIQMNMIADGFTSLKPPGQKINAVDKFVGHTNHVKESSVYKIMRIGILINDILTLRVDFEFCHQGKSGGIFGTRPNDDAVCLEYTQTDTAGNRIMTFRTDLHQKVIILCNSLMDGEGYDDNFILVVKTNVIDPYIKLLQDAKISSEESTRTIAGTLERLKLEESILKIGNNTIVIDDGLETLVKEVNDALTPKPPLKVGAQGGGTQVGGGFWSNKTTSAPAGPTAAQTNIIEYLKNNPVELISHDALKSYLDKVYKFSKEITKQSEEEKKETAKSVDASAVASTGPVTGPGTGGSRRNRKRPTTRKYSKSSSSIKKGKTYKIRI
jgi:hypothetical protein